MAARPICICLIAAFGLIGCGPPAQPVEEIAAPEQTTAAPEITVGADDWAWWRGPNRNNVANTPTAPQRWSESENVVWKTTIPGRGHGSPTVVGDRIFLCTADESQQIQQVVCFDRASGEQLWTTDIHSGNFPSTGQMHGKSTHANCTVACDGSSIFVGFLNNEHITATSLTLDGEIRWQTDLGYFGSKFGYAASPCLHESLAIYAADNFGGGFIAAVHRETGDIVWRKKRNNVSTYSSPIVAEIGNRWQLLISGDNQIASFDPGTGEELWSAPGTAEATCGTVVWHENLVFGSGGYPERQTLCVDATTGQKVWEDRLKAYEQSMLVAGNELYTFTDDGILVCRDTATGKVHWRERLSGPVSASPLLVGTTIYATNESGTTWVFEATPEGYQEIAKNQLGNEGFASPVAVDGQLFVRTASGNGPGRSETLYCLGTALSQ